MNKKIENITIEQSLIRLNSLLDKKREKLLIFMNNEIYDQCCQRFETKLNDDEYDEQKHNSSSREMSTNNGSYSNSYQIGKCYWYTNSWPYYEQKKLKKDIINDALYSQHLINGYKYKTMKEEILIYLNIFDWNFIHIYIENILYKCLKVKQLKCNFYESDGFTVYYYYENSTNKNINQSCSISMQHILALFLYSNFYEIRKRFHFNLNSNEFTHFGSFLREAISLFGLNIYQDSAADNFYHRFISNSLYFDGKILLRLSAPTMMTTQQNIIQLYSNTNAYVTQLGKHGSDSMVHYFNVNWLSNRHSMDNECLFIGGKYPLKILSIYDFLSQKKCNNYEKYFIAIDIINNLLKGKSNPMQSRMNQRLANDKFNHKKKMEKYVLKNRFSNANDNDIQIPFDICIAIESLFYYRVKNDENEVDECLSPPPIYMQNYFDKFCENIDRQIDISLILLNTEQIFGYSYIKYLFIDDADDENIKEKNDTWVKFDVLYKLFPNLHTIKIKKLFVNKNTFENLLKFLKKNINEYGNEFNLKQIIFENSEVVAGSGNFSLKSCVLRNTHKFERIDWNIGCNKYYTMISFKKSKYANWGSPLGKNIQIVDELKEDMVLSVKMIKKSSSYAKGDSVNISFGTLAGDNDDNDVDGQLKDESNNIWADLF